MATAKKKRVVYAPKTKRPPKAKEVEQDWAKLQRQMDENTEKLVKISLTLDLLIKNLCKEARTNFKFDYAKNYSKK